MSAAGPLAGRRVVVTRREAEPLAGLLTRRGAEPVHVPLIDTVDPADGGRELATELDRLGGYDWLIVTSPAGASRVGAAAARVSGVRLAAVGSSTADVLSRRAGRPVDLVPDDQRASALLDTLRGAMQPPRRLLLALADRASDRLAAGLREAGHDVTSVVAYRTVATPPSADVVDRVRREGADAVLFASGSAAASWVDAFGTWQPEVAVAIGPSTETAALRSGLKLAGVAADHSLTGLVAELERCFARPPG